MKEKIKIYLTPKYLLMLIFTVVIFVCGFIFIPMLTAQADTFLATAENTHKMLSGAEMSHEGSDSGPTNNFIYFGGNEYWVVHKTESGEISEGDEASLSGTVTLFAKKPYLYLPFSSRAFNASSTYNGSYIHNYLNGVKGTSDGVNSIEYPTDSYGKDKMIDDISPTKYDGTPASDFKTDFFTGKETEWNSVKSGIEVKVKKDTVKNYPLNPSASATFYLPDAKGIEEVYGYAYGGLSAFADGRTNYIIPMNYGSRKNIIDEYIQGETILSRAWYSDFEAYGYYTYGLVKDPGEMISYHYPQIRHRTARMVAPVCNIIDENILFTSYREEQTDGTVKETLEYNVTTEGYLNESKAIALMLEDKEGANIATETNVIKKSDDETYYIDYVKAIGDAEAYITFKCKGDLATGEYISVLLDGLNSSNQKITQLILNPDVSHIDSDGNTVYKINKSKFTKFDISKSLGVKVLACKDNTYGNYSTATEKEKVATKDFTVDNYFIRYARVIGENSALTAKTLLTINTLTTSAGKISSFTPTNTEYEIDVDWDYSQVDFKAGFDDSKIIATLYDWKCDTVTPAIDYVAGENLSKDKLSAFTRDSDHKDFPPKNVTVTYKIVTSPKEDTANYVGTTYYVKINSKDKPILSNLTAILKDSSGTEQNILKWEPEFGKGPDAEYETDYTISTTSPVSGNKATIIFTPTCAEDGCTLRLMRGGEEIPINDGTFTIENILPGKEMLYILCEKAGKSTNTYKLNIEMMPDKAKASVKINGTQSYDLTHFYTKQTVNIEFPNNTIFDSANSNRNVMIIYTTDNTEPSLTNGTKVELKKGKTETADVELSEDTVLKACVCVYSGTFDNPKNTVLGKVLTKEYTFEKIQNPALVTPTDKSTQYGDFGVQLKSETKVATLKYSINNESYQDLPNNGGFTVTKDKFTNNKCIIKAYSVISDALGGGKSSEVEFTFYYEDLPKLKPTVDPGYYCSETINFQLNIRNSKEEDIPYKDGEIVYTVDGTDPKSGTGKKVKYKKGATIELSKEDAQYVIGTTYYIPLKVYAHLGDIGADRDAVEYSYYLTAIEPVQAASFNGKGVTSGHFYNDVEETLTNETPVDKTTTSPVEPENTLKIYYTTDGTTPSTTSTPYTGKILITKAVGTTKTIKAIAYKNGVNSGVQEFNYTFVESFVSPTPDPDDSRTYYATQTTLLKHDDSNAVLHCKVDGAEITDAGNPINRQPFDIKKPVFTEKEIEEGAVKTVTLETWAISLMGEESTPHNTYTYNFQYAIPEPEIEADAEQTNGLYYQDFNVEINALNSDFDIKYNFGSETNWINYTSGTKIPMLRSNANKNAKITFNVRVSSKYGGSKDFKYEYIFGSLTAAIEATPISGETYYTDEILWLSSEDSKSIEGLKIKLTTDGSIPTLENGEDYDTVNGKTITKNVTAPVTVRAITYYEKTVSTLNTFIYEFADVPKTEIDNSKNVDITDTSVTSYQSQTITLKNTNAYVNYRYTYSDTPDDDDPTKEGTDVEENTIKISRVDEDGNLNDGTLKVVAYVMDLGSNARVYSSEISTVEYTFNDLEVPAAEPTGGTYDEKQTVTLSSVENATILYSIDGSENPEKIYSGSIELNPTKNNEVITLTAKAQIEDAESELLTQNYTFVVVQDVKCNLDSGEYYGTKTIELSCDTADSSIYYTLDGTVPNRLNTETTHEYTAPFSISKETKLRAVAYKNDFVSINMLSRDYTFAELPSPTSTLQTGTYYQTKKNVEFNCSVSDAEIRYTTNGEPPTLTTGAKYDGPITVNMDVENKQTYMIKAFKDGGESPTSTFVYSFANVPQSEADVKTGTYYDDLNILLTNTSKVVSTRYTRDGSDPAKSSTAKDYVPGSYITISKAVGKTEILTVKAYLFDGDDKLYSDAVTYKYTFEETAPPEASLAEGTYHGDKTTTLSTKTASGKIYYNINSSDAPTKDNGIRYTLGTSIKLNKSLKDTNNQVTLKAITYSSDLSKQSKVTTLVYTFVEIAAPTISVDTGEYYDSQTVTMSCNDTNEIIKKNAVIRYTLDGSNPVSSSTAYVNGSPITIDKNTAGGVVTLKAASFYADGSSDVVTKVYTFKNITMPTADVETGTYYTNQKVTLNCSYKQHEVIIKYAINGDEFDHTYTGPITIEKNTASPVTLKAKAFLKTDESFYSDTGSWTYTFKTLNAPTADIGTGTYYINQKVTLSETDEDIDDIVIRYTTDGKDPTTGSTVYTQPITIEKNATTPITLKAAEFLGTEKSSILTCVYTFKNIAAPLAIPGTGTYTASQTVSLTAEQESAEIRYTLDGTDPVVNSALYSEPVKIVRNVETPVVLKATTFYKGIASTVMTYTYTFKNIGTPTVYPVGGTYYASQYITAECDSAGAVMRYTLDGTEPTSLSTEYTGAISIEKNVTSSVILKIRAFCDGMQSDVNTQAYNFVSDGWTKDRITGKWKYRQNGKLITGLHSDIKGWDETFYFDDEGNMVVGWKENLPGYTGWVYFESNSNKATYGAMVRGWVKDVPGYNRWYYFNESTAIMQTGFLHTSKGNTYPGGLTYYVNPNFADDSDITIGWQFIDGYWYYFRPDWGGAMAFSTIIDGYEIDASGKMII